jgi:hypothetical protein
MRASLFAALTLAACSIPEKHFDNGGAIDAPQVTIDTPSTDAPFGFPDAANPIDANPNAPDAGAPFACMGQPFPTTAPPTVTVSGVVAKLDTGGTVAGATVAGYPNGSTTPFVTTTTDANGNFSATINTGGLALNGYIKMTGSGVVDAYVYPEAPISMDASVAIETFTAPLTTVGLDPTKAQLVLQVHDCNGVPLAGAVFSLQPTGGQLVYIKNGTTDPTATSTDSSGVAIVTNQPPGNATLNAVVNGTSLRQHVFPAVANAITTADIQP